jgi:hypothetical protein
VYKIPDKLTKTISVIVVASDFVSARILSDSHLYENKVICDYFYCGGVWDIKNAVIGIFN